MLSLRGVSRVYGRVAALKPTDWSVATGQTTCLIGPSGSGKSTVLKLMLGLLKPDTGQVFFDGQPLTRGNLLSVRRRIGYVVQDGGLFPHLTAGENAALLLRHLHHAPSAVAARLGELALLTRLPEEALRRYPVQLSGGQRQRVSLMRALMLDPDVLLLDEPLGALDPMIRSELGDDLREIFRTLKKTVVLVTHDMAEAAFFGDRLVLMKDGAILQEGSFEDLVTRPADPFVSEFINAQRRLPSLSAALPG
jgi:osmoprotectant transport system ATP-binding protein